MKNQNHLRTDAKASHTPGPWSYKHCKVWSHESNGNDFICDANTFDLGKEANEANARLIAAAPELLEALIAVRAEIWSAFNEQRSMNLNEQNVALSLADALIAKATGGAE